MKSSFWAWLAGWVVVFATVCVVAGLVFHTPTWAAWLGSSIIANQFFPVDK